MSAKLLVLSNSNTVTLHAYGKMVCDLCVIPLEATVTRDVLLCAPVVSEIRVYAKKVVTGFSRD